MKAIIIAGGLGKRLAPLTNNLPKPMLQINAKPILEYQIIHLKRFGIKNIIIATSYLSHMIEDYFQDGTKWGVKISYSREKEPLGTGGAIKNAESFLDETFFVLYADLVVRVDLSKLLAFHKEKQAAATLTVHPSSHPHDSDIIELRKDGSISRFLGKPKENQDFVNIANAGLYCCEPSILKFFPKGKSMLDTEVLPNALADGAPLFGYLTDEEICDIGTFERLSRFRC